tara:strand:+ start:2173 stop:2637 length:465 start_codon:yes stop_codon:yes gene_type:complete
MDKIELTPHNMLAAGLVGVSRQVKGLKKAGRYGVNNEKTGWQIHCDGACGEMAVAKWSGVFYDGALGDFEAKDAGKYQVRTNPNDWGDLILHPRDNDDDIFILVLSHESPVFYLRGWLYGREGKKKEYWRDGTKGRPAFFAPQEILRDVAELKP